MPPIAELYYTDDDDDMTYYPYGLKAIESVVDAFEPFLESMRDEIPKCSFYHQFSQRGSQHLRRCRRSPSHEDTCHSLGLWLTEWMFGSPAVWSFVDDPVASWPGVHTDAMVEVDDDYAPLPPKVVFKLGPKVSDDADHEGVQSATATNVVFLSFDENNNPAQLDGLNEVVNLGVEVFEDVEPPRQPPVGEGRFIFGVWFPPMEPKFVASPEDEKEEDLMIFSDNEEVDDDDGDDDDALFEEELGEEGGSGDEDALLEDADDDDDNLWNDIFVPLEDMQRVFVSKESAEVGVCGGAPINPGLNLCDYGLTIILEEEEEEEEDSDDTGDTCWA